MEEEKSPIEQMSRSVNAIGMGMSKNEMSKRYFGNVPDGAYVGRPKDLSTMHDLNMSKSQKSRLYGIGKAPVEDVGDIVNTRLETDSKSGLIRELTENTSMTRVEAEELVRNWMEKNSLVEVDDSTLEKIIVPKGRRS